MKKTNCLAAVLSVCAVALLAACQSKPVQETAKGVVMDATMNNITLVSEQGDTLNISTMDADPALVPGVLVGDAVDVTYERQKAGDVEILQAVGLTVTTHSPYFFIAGTWLEPNPVKAGEMQGVTLAEGGTASSEGMETLLFENWQFDGKTLILKSKSIGNKQTIEVSDTLQVVKLDADSLVLANKAGEKVWNFGRKK